MKPCISRNGRKKIPNGIKGYNPFPTMGTMKEMDPHGV
jgi:hypothetical protein